ncbi:MAG: DUF1786 domain-containing protein [Chloroflexota bacterium]
MKILAVDVGTGTQDIVLFDSQLDVENSFKLVVPAPTMIIHRRLKSATQRGVPVALHGVTMGGGPSHWAAEAHIKTGYPVYATPSAARSFNDDLDQIREMGIELISDDEVSRLPSDVEIIEMRDFDFESISAAFKNFGVSLNDLAAVAVAVFDHGDAPAGYSDRQFRFDYLNERISISNRLADFAFSRQDVPRIMTRLQAVVNSASKIDAPLVVMDTAPAAVLGATFDPVIQTKERVLIANIGNFHTLAFRLSPEGIEGVFEHHTGLIDLPKLENLLRALADGTLKHEDVFGDHGHGALIYSDQPLDLNKGSFGVGVTGPRQSLMQNSTLRPHFAAPFGDMMLAGCYGLLSAVGGVLPDLEEEVIQGLTLGSSRAAAPWEFD